jgi:predicted nucleic acid-binding protein
MSADAFLDTNIVLRHLIGDNPELSPKATVIFQTIEAGRLRVRLSHTVIFEVVFTMERSYGLTKSEIRDALLPLIELPGITLPGKRLLSDTLDLYVERNLPFADASHAVLMLHEGIADIFSFDRHFERVPGIRRLESPRGD